MKDGNNFQGWFHRIQSLYVLSLARGMYLMVALISIFIIIGGIIFTLYLQSVISSQPLTIPLPPSYQKTAINTSRKPVNLEMVTDYLKPPNNIKFVVTTGIITLPLSQDVVFGYFTANTPNNLASYPDGISILGGPDAALFEKTFNSEYKKSIGLKARSVLINEITNLLNGLTEKKDRTFEINVTARDRYGITSPVTNISFILNFGPLPIAPVALIEPPPEPTELQKIAGEIAKTIESTINSAYFEVHRTALKVPIQCGTNDSNHVFINNYRRAFEQVRTQLTALNVTAFYAGLCAAWQDVLQREAAERESAAQAQAEAYQEAEEKREHVQAYNYEMLRKHEYEADQAKANTSRTMWVIGGALFTFLTISIILAFMAIESHSRAVREAMESMVRLAKEKNGLEKQ